MLSRGTKWKPAGGTPGQQEQKEEGGKSNTADGVKYFFLRFVAWSPCACSLPAADTANLDGSGKG